MDIIRVLVDQIGSIEMDCRFLLNLISLKQNTHTQIKKLPNLSHLVNSHRCETSITQLNRCTLNSSDYLNSIQRDELKITQDLKRDEHTDYTVNHTHIVRVTHTHPKSLNQLHRIFIE